jgi:hypothetical protein
MRDIASYRFVMTAQQNIAYSTLVQAWKRRDDLRHSHADIRDLAAARRQLDGARIEMARVRAF